MQNSTSNKISFDDLIMNLLFRFYFHRNYDADASFERMRKAGLFVAAPADD